MPESQLRSLQCEAYFIASLVLFSFHGPSSIMAWLLFFIALSESRLKKKALAEESSR